MPLMSKKRCIVYSFARYKSNIVERCNLAFEFVAVVAVTFVPASQAAAVVARFVAASVAQGLR